ncbi:MAG: response regulator transcription factor [Holosporales bacterium]|jgi:two-component system response regulator RegA
MTRNPQSLLLVDDDMTFCSVLQESLAPHYQHIACAYDAAAALDSARITPFDNALIDLKMPKQSGLSLIEPLLALQPALRIVVLTGYASIPTAVEAIKLGAVHYLSKPVTVADIMQAFERSTGDPSIPVADTPTLEDAEWAHILTTLERNHHNISATARELGMHLRTLQRKLQKIPRRFRVDQSD